MSKLKTIMLFAVASLLSPLAQAEINAANGFYLGIQYGMYHHPLPDGTAILSFTDNGAALQPFIGYRINDYFAVESHYYYLGNQSHSYPYNSDSYFNFGPDHYHEHAIELAGKIIYPAPNNVSLFAKLGAALVHQNVYNQDWVGSPPVIDSNVTRLLPSIGFGLSYNFNKNVATDITATHIQGSGVIENIEMLGVGLSYTFSGI